MSPPPAGSPTTDPRPARPRARPGDRTISRGELNRQPGFADVSPEVGELDVQAFEDALERSPDTALVLLADMARATDEKLRAAARQLAARVVLDRGRAGRTTQRGIGKLRAVPADRGGDLDLDASLEAVADARATGRSPALDELVARTWAKPHLALCLLIDASGSMGGARLAAAALTAAACTWRAPGDHAVLAFAKHTTVLRPMHSTRPAAEVVDKVLELRGHGVTALATALGAAAEHLERSRATRKVVVLLSDCRATDEQDPIPVARVLPELVILAPADDHESAAAFAGATGARWRPMSGPDDAPAALLDLMNE